MIMVIANISTIIFMNTANIPAICPLCVIERNMPKIYSGRKGMIIFSIDITIMDLKSFMAFRSDMPFMAVIPTPRRKAAISALITPKSGGISIVKYGVRVVLLSVTASSVSLPMSDGYTCSHIK